jgi:hypothetical protein
VIRLALLSLLVPLQDAPNEDGLRGAWNELRLRGAEQRAELARWSFDGNLFREAGLLARDVQLVVPEHEVGELIAQIAAVEGEPFVRLYEEGLKEHGREYRKRHQGIHEPLANELVELARAADKAGFAALAEEVWLDAFGIDPGNSKAHSALKKLDYDLIYNYGAIPQRDKEVARKALKRLGGGFLNRRDLAEELETWSDVWGLETRHYTFLTNAPHQTVFSFAQACEDLHEAWEQVMDEGRVKLKRSKDPLVVHFYDSPATYEAIVRTRGYDAPRSEDVLGFYSSQTEIGYFYDNPGFYNGDPTLLFETFYHEGTHQLCDQRMKVAWRGENAKHTTAWATEGIALYMELLEVRGAGRERTFQLGQFVDDDLAAGVALHRAGELMELDAFLGISAEAFGNYDHGYPHAALLTHFLMEAGEGKWRRDVFIILEETYEQGGIRRPVHEVLELEREELRALFDAHVDYIEGRLPFREYAGHDD